MKAKQKTIDLVLGQIKEDYRDGDLTALDELLKCIPEENLRAYLPERLTSKK